MKSIKGYSLINVVYFKGHDKEELVQGDIVFNGKIIGWYSQDFMGGDDWIDIPSFEDSKLLENASYKYFEEFPDPFHIQFKLTPGISDFMNEIIS